ILRYTPRRWLLPPHRSRFRSAWARRGAGLLRTSLAAAASLERRLRDRQSPRPPNVSDGAPVSPPRGPAWQPIPGIERRGSGSPKIWMLSLPTGQIDPRRHLPGPAAEGGRTRAARSTIWSHRAGGRDARPLDCTRRAHLAQRLGGQLPTGSGARRRANPRDGRAVAGARRASPRRLRRPLESRGDARGGRGALACLGSGLNTCRTAAFNLA